MTDQIDLPCGKTIKGVVNAAEIIRGGRVNMPAKDCSGCDNFTPYNYKTHGYCTFGVLV